MGKRKSVKHYKIDKSYLYFLLFIGFILLLILFNYDKITNLIINPQQKKNMVSIKPKQEYISVLDAIAHAKLLLGVTEENYKNHIGEDAIYISIGINSSEMDLNYANIIITGQVELIGGKILAGKEKYNGNKQILEIEDPRDSQKYFVTLYYNKSQNETKVKIKSNCGKL